ncbi:MAG: serpin family protein [Gemmatimonadetes bacterium]|nr:serpin family protein [Gemmatimonadota bacterium]
MEQKAPPSWASRLHCSPFRVVPWHWAMSASRCERGVPPCTTQKRPRRFSGMSRAEPRARYFGTFQSSHGGAMRAELSRRSRSLRRTLALAFAIVFSACGDGITSPERITELPRSLSSGELALISAGNSFAVSLLRTVYEDEPDSTVFLSPLSASMALGMALNGAQGATRDQMRSTLGFGTLSMDEVNRCYEALIGLLGGLDPRVDFRLANALFHRDEFVMEAPFLETVRRHFDARVQGLDFAAPAAVTAINGWVRESTGGRIGEIIEAPIDPLTMAFLMNAIYFRGDWTRSFDPAKTVTGPFRLRDGGTASVRFMVKEDSVGYREGAGWHAAELSYGGGAWVMDVAVPRDGNDLMAVVSALGEILDPDASWPRRTLTVSLPRFQLEWERDLNRDLQELGMRDAFDPGAADFTPMYRKALEAGLYVKKVKQKTFLSVDEVGTEAAAVTSVEMGIKSAPSWLKADRPFLVAIRERLSGTVLFAGFVVQAPQDRTGVWPWV